MSQFKRSPSKVFWQSESLEWREISSSPGSQDSGFSDSEIIQQTTAQRIPQEIFKNLTNEDKSPNLSQNYREKLTPNKTQISPEKRRYQKHSPKVSRKLFTNKQKHHQYARDIANEERRPEDVSFSFSLSENAREILFTKTTIEESEKHPVFLNSSAPAVLEPQILEKFREDEAVTSFNSLSSDCESELECLFTSTPKSTGMRTKKRISGRLHPRWNLDDSNRVPPIFNPNLDSQEENHAVKNWMEILRNHYETECMTTLQSKSIQADLNQKVSQKAASLTTKLRALLCHSRCINNEFFNLNSDNQHVGPLIQSYSGLIKEFLNEHLQVQGKLSELLEQLRCSQNLNLVKDLQEEFEGTLKKLLEEETKRLVGFLENPASELALRATIQAITSLSLRNEPLIQHFTCQDIIPILLILIEKCEASSLRTQLLRALSTICSNSSSIRQFEKFSGVQIIADTIEDHSRPEPERAEGIALLAQITAPWLEDNHTVKGLGLHSKTIIKSLSIFLLNTKCCQNILLTTAALANLTTMDPKSLNTILEFQTIPILLQVVKQRGPRVSVYLLEQVATLLANMSSLEKARQQLIEVEAPMALISFLKVNHSGLEVGRRLQQKAIIALSRLCGDQSAARQVISMGGTEKLVKICRDKGERFDNDAVLVAALATLRKIADSCGSSVLSAQDCQELVQPKLLDSFLAYSSQNESYV